MRKPFRVTLPPDIHQTPEIKEWLRLVEGVLNHPENAEPLLDVMSDASAHYLLCGHLVADFNIEECLTCGLRWRLKAVSE